MNFRHRAALAAVNHVATDSANLNVISPPCFQTSSNAVDFEAMDLTVQQFGSIATGLPDRSMAIDCMLEPTDGSNWLLVMPSAEASGNTINGCCGLIVAMLIITESLNVGVLIALGELIVRPSSHQRRRPGVAAESEAVGSIFTSAALVEATVTIESEHEVDVLTKPFVACQPQFWLAEDESVSQVDDGNFL